MKLKELLLLYLLCCIASCSDNTITNSRVQTTFKFTHNWDGELVTNTNFNTIQYTNENGELLSIERLRYIISNITFTATSGENLVINGHNLVDLTHSTNLSYSPTTLILAGNYNVSFTFGLNNEDNAQNYSDLNSVSFNVPENLGGGYHYMQFDGKFINSNSLEQGFNYHAIRAVNTLGETLTFPKDTFFTVNLGTITISDNIEIEIKMNIAEWFKNPNTWDLNQLNQMLMPNAAAQDLMYQNGQNVFSLGEISQ